MLLKELLSVPRLILMEDAVDKTMYINSKIGDFKSFISTDTGFGTIEWKAGKPVLNVVYGNIDVKRYNVSGKIVD